MPERASCWSSLPLPLTSLPGHIPPGQTTLRPRRKSSINLQASQLQKSHLHPPACPHVLGSALPWCPGYASTRLAPASPSYVTSTGLDWVADAEIRPRRGKPPKPGSYTAWFPWQPSHSRQTVQGGGGGVEATPVQGTARAGSDLSLLVGETSLSESPRTVLLPKNYRGSQVKL